MTKRELKIFITEYKIGRKRFAGPNILAFDFPDAESKIKLHNKTTKNPLILVGQFIKDV